MEPRTADAAYRLIWETEHLQSCDEEYDFELEEFLEWDNTNGFYETTTYQLPNPIVFYGHPVALACLDYPTNNVYWPVMSRRMYNTLTAVGHFPHQIIPIAVMDSTQYPFEPEQRLANGQPKPEITNFDDFVVVQLLEHSEFFDFEHSSYARNSRHPDWIDAIEIYVLNEPPEGFPPLFRLSPNPAELFISAKARAALLEAGIQGTAYYPLNCLQVEVDNTVELVTSF
jgi:hypothetical protein